MMLLSSTGRLSFFKISLEQGLLSGPRSEAQGGASAPNHRQKSKGRRKPINVEEECGGLLEVQRAEKITLILRSFVHR